MPTFKIDGYTFLDGEEPLRGPIVPHALQQWSEYDILGEGSPGTVMTHVGAASQVLKCSSRASTATKDKLVAVFEAGEDILFITPQQTTGIKVLMRRLAIDHEDPLSNSKHLCEFDLYVREDVGATPEEVEDVPTVLRKTADETVNNSSGLQLDDDLVLAVLANEVWVVEYGLFITSSVANMRFQINVPAGASGQWGIQYRGKTSGLEHAKTDGQGFASPISDVDAETLGFLQIYASVLVGGSAGNIELFWAQEVADASDSKVLLGSYLVARKQT